MANFPKTAEIRVTARTASGVWCELTYEDPAATYTLPIKAGQGVRSTSFSVVKTAFNDSPTLTIGDGSDVDGFQDNSDIALGTAATATTPAVKLFSASGNPYANGKVYLVDDTVDFIWNPAAATAGVVRFYVELTSKMEHDGVTP
jgi:hypothetical protein